MSPPRKSGSWLWWIVGFAGAAVVLLIVGGALVAGYFVRGIKVGGKARQVEISTPAGNVTLSADSVKDVGLPVYPGARLVESGGSLDITTPQGQRAGLAAVHYRTSDPWEKVDAWYRAHLGLEFRREVAEGHSVSIRIKDVEIKKDDIAFIADKGELVRIVVLSTSHPGADIALVRLGKQEPQ